VAAVAGALAGSLRRAGRGASAWLRSRGWAVLTGAFAVDFAVRLVLFHTLAEVEHLVALSAGFLLGRWWWPVSSPVHGDPGTLAVVDGARRSR
jgi:hypothetical protein